jgi:hypothetical protein
MMHGPEKSDPAIVAGKPTNKVERSAAELVERRAGAEGNAGQQSTRWTQCRLSVSQALARIRQTTAVDTRGGSRMRESRTYGSGRGARGNSRPYREIPAKWPLIAPRQGLAGVGYAPNRHDAFSYSAPSSGRTTRTNMSRGA